MGILIFIALLFLAFFGFRWFKNQANTNPVKQKNKPATDNASANRAANSFRCVEIEPCLGACEAVKPYKRIKILLDKAPALPLHGCDHKKCECKFIRFSDRRSDERRERHASARQVIAGNEIISSNKNKRTITERRKAQPKN